MTLNEVQDIHRRILAFEGSFDVSLFDKVVTSFYQGSGSQEVHQGWHTILNDFKNHPESWKLVIDIFKESQVMQSKIVVLSSLILCIQQRWRVLPTNHKSGMRNFLEETIVSLSSKDVLNSEEEILLNKLNTTLIEILKKEWPHNWPNFISELVQASAQKTTICTNSMKILQILSEEICGVEKSEESISLTKVKRDELKKSLQNEFQNLFQFCMVVLEKCSDVKLLRQTLKTLARFISWMPLGYIFETKLLEMITLKYYPSSFQEPALDCLTEIAAIDLTSEANKAKWEKSIIDMFTNVHGFTAKWLNVNESFEKHESNPTSLKFFRPYANYMNSIVRTHIRLLEEMDVACVALQESLLICIRITEMNDIELLKICLDMWKTLVSDLMDIVKVPNALSHRLNDTQTDPKFGLYKNCLSSLRIVIMERMVRPKEVLVTQNSQGEIVHEVMKDTVHLMIYETQKDILFNLTVLDPHNTRSQIMDKLEMHNDATQWNPHQLNSLCWAIGSISDALSEDYAKSFIVHVIKLLLSLCELKRGKENKALIAANIMYVVRKYPRFLKKHWKFLKTVMNKLIEFMHELFPGVQDMAVETFHEILCSCKTRFLKQQEGETELFLEYIIRDIPSITSSLKPQHQFMFYEALGELVNAEWNPESRENLIDKFMLKTNNHWSELTQQGRNDPSSIGKEPFVQVLRHCLQLNYYVARALGDNYRPQFGRIVVEMLKFFQMHADYAREEISKDVMLKQNVNVRRSLAVKNDILKLVDMVFGKFSKGGSFHQVFKTFGGVVLMPVLEDYNKGPAEGRDPLVLHICIVLLKCVSKVGCKQSPEEMQIVRDIFTATFHCTLEMLRVNMEDYSDHRKLLFELIQILVTDSFEVVEKFSNEEATKIIQTIIWGMNHLDANISERSLLALNNLIGNIESSSSRNQFFKEYLMVFLKEVFKVLTDKLHKSGLVQQCNVLQKIFQIIKSGCITVPIWTGNHTAFNNNQQFICNSFRQLLAEHYKNLTEQVLTRFIEELIANCRENEAFRQTIRDFLIFSQEFHKPI